MGAGILPVSIHKNKLHFLFGQEENGNKWSDFGGRSESNETDLQTAIREGYEELNGYYGTMKEFKQLVKNNTLLTYIKGVNKQYQAAAKQTIKSINKHLGLPLLEPEGGLYTCMKVSSDGGKFVEDILKNTGVLFVPGWGFGRSVKDAVRISYGPLVNDIEKIDLGFKRVANYLNK